MRCETCHGTGEKQQKLAEHLKPIRFICPDCLGSGVAHCCDGICEQPETTETFHD